MILALKKLRTYFFSCFYAYTVKKPQKNNNNKINNNKHSENIA